MTPSPVTCTTDNLPITVGKVKTLTCDLQALNLNLNSKIEFLISANLENTKPDPNAKYEVQFLDKPIFQGNLVSQNFTSYKIGNQSFKNVKIKIGEEEHSILGPTFEVKSVIPQTGSSPTPFPLVAPEEVSIPLWWWGIWGFLFLLIICVGVWQFIKIKRKKAESQALAQVTQLTPQEKFHSKIRKLESKGLHLKGEYKAFALELTNIIKKTIGEELAFASEDLTSEELLLTLERRHRAYFTIAGGTLTHFLADLDQIKFAKIETDAQKCAHLLDRGAQIGNALFGRTG